MIMSSDDEEQGWRGWPRHVRRLYKKKGESSHENWRGRLRVKTHRQRFMFEAMDEKAEVDEDFEKSGWHGWPRPVPALIGTQDNSLTKKILPGCGLPRSELHQSGHEPGTNDKEAVDEDLNDNVAVNTHPDEPEDKVELISESNVFISQKSLQEISKRWSTKPRELCRRIMKAVVGKENLVKMTPMGLCSGFQPIPANVVKFVEQSINRTVQKKYRINRVEYMRILTLMCNTMRNPKPYNRKCRAANTRD